MPSNTKKTEAIRATKKRPNKANLKATAKRIRANEELLSKHDALQK